jgi:hypothetical protein
MLYFCIKFTHFSPYILNAAAKLPHSL